MKSNRARSSLILSLLALLLAAFAPPALAQDEQAAEAEPEEESKVIAIVGGDIYTVTREIIRRGTILVRDGKIESLGQRIEVPEGAEVIDASGMIVTPGFIALNASRIGISGQTGGQNRLADALNPFDRNIEFLLGSGITTICVSTGGGGGGRGGRRGGRGRGGGGGGASSSAVIKMTHGDLEGMLLAEDPFYTVGANTMTGSLNRFNWRQTLDQGRDYLKQQAEGGGNRGRGGGGRGRGGRGGGRAPVDENILRLLRGEVPLRTRVSQRDQILDMIALSSEFGYELILEGAEEAWLVADQLSEARVPVIITPRSTMSPRPGLEDSTGASITTSGILESSGVPFAINALSGSVSLGGIAGRDLMSLPLEAAYAVRGGASEQTALEAITIIPAEMLGLDDRIGSLEVGKDADILIMDGHPLDYRTYVETAMVNGKVYYERAVNRIFPVFDRVDK